ncbi:MAG: fatty acid/phospholipid synthesis protein PlsX [Clostridia bacterium]|nr:fatty acid/phospholipid synthesis protein PlsX [Clostridia bacterium]MBQ4341199.1 fatty acid/phospholipid synthesis protein PlsX [Clostridia bacterium]MBR6428519.1 fatty acid/phospholipid synthesis protein PlsX [Clostridia bacterium]
MDLAPYFKSIIDGDPAQVVICDMDDTIIYMNAAAAEAEAKHGGFALLGRDLKACHSPKSREAIARVKAWFAKDTANNCVHTFYNEKQNKDVYMVALRDEGGTLIGYYEKHSFRTRDAAPFYELS